MYVANLFDLFASVIFYRIYLIEKIIFCGSVLSFLTNRKMAAPLYCTAVKMETNELSIAP